MARAWRRLVLKARLGGYPVPECHARVGWIGQRQLPRTWGKACGKIPGMATVKITVTVPQELAEYIRTQVASGAYESVSAFVTQAAESTRDLEPLDLLIASMVAESGEPDERAQAWAAEAVAAARRARQRAEPGDGGRAA